MLSLLALIWTFTAAPRTQLRPKYNERLPVALESFVMSSENAGDNISWLSTPAAAKRLGITPRTLYRFIDEGQLPAYKFGRVIRLKQTDVDIYIASCLVEPGSMSHLYPETVGGVRDDS
jgi:excisionase family DNA binding protein